MTTAITVASPAVIKRMAPPLGGFNLTFLGLELRSMLRNKRTVIFAVLMPIVLFVLLALPQVNQTIGSGSTVTVMAYDMVSFAVYGAMTACASGGSMVAVERALGWSRQLRLTPLRPAAYVATKILAAMFLGLIPVVSVFVVGAFSHVHLPLHAWILCGLGAWLGSLVFAALGLFMGYVLPSENVMQIVGPVLAILSIFGGIFYPLNASPHLVQEIAKFIPMYGVGEVARAPLGGEFHWTSVLNIVAWTVTFMIGAALVFRRDTKRV
jgi:ABC-2 type transport system permease protein